MNKTYQELCDENQMLRAEISSQEEQITDLAQRNAQLLAARDGYHRLCDERGQLTKKLIDQLSKGNADYRALVGYVERLTEAGDAVARLCREPELHDAWYEIREESIGGAIATHAAEIHKRVWDNGYLNGREDTLSEQAQKDGAIERGEA